MEQNGLYAVKILKLKECVKTVKLFYLENFPIHHMYIFEERMFSDAINSAFTQFNFEVM